jgi:hypothetical protein
MAHGRWYPTTTTLGDGRVLTFSGLLETSGTNTTSGDLHSRQRLSPQYAAGWTPPLYPRLHLLPNGNCLLFPVQERRIADLQHNKQHVVRCYGATDELPKFADITERPLLLPLTPANGYRPRVMVFGGGNPATRDDGNHRPGSLHSSMAIRPSMSQPRIEMNATILPNGKILATGGSTNDEDTATASYNADLYDPNSNSFSSADCECIPASVSLGFVASA